MGKFLARISLILVTVVVLCLFTNYMLETSKERQEIEAAISQTQQILDQLEALDRALERLR